MDPETNHSKSSSQEFQLLCQVVSSLCRLCLRHANLSHLLQPCSMIPEQTLAGREAVEDQPQSQQGHHVTENDTGPTRHVPDERGSVKTQADERRSRRRLKPVFG